MSRKKVIKAVHAYVMDMADELRLYGWRIKVPIEPTDDPEAFAQCEAVEGRKLANVHFCNGFESLEPSDIHEVIIHELLHLVERDMCDTIRLGMHEAGMGRSAYDALYECFRVQREIMVDHLAAVLADKISINKKLMKAITEQGKKKG